MVVCKNCGEENPERARFCLSCGASLAAPVKAEETRKTVTILFSDVTGSTAMGEKLDPESLRNVMTRYFDEMRAVIEAHSGTVEKFIGDAIMAVFGVPVLHEDDALRAVRAAAEMRDALWRLNVELERDRGVTIQTRTGVNTGEVVAGSGDQMMATGDAVNTAARLEQHAAPGDILLGEQTYRLVRHAVVAEPASPVDAKGKSEPLMPYRLIRVSDAAPDAGRRLDSPLVGRDNELALAEQAFERAVRERSCSLFTIFGSAGVGKSRLTQEVVRSVEMRATLSRGRCLPYGRGITFWPLIEIVQGMAGLSDGDSVDKARRGVRKLLAQEDDADVITDRIVQVLGLGEQEVRAEETFWAVRKLFESLARRQPLVVVFDDIHWAEPTLLDLIEHVADLSRDVSILLMCIARPELLERRPSWGGGKMNASSILLEPLRAEESAQLMANLLGGMALPPPVEKRISETAEGNPLFVEEMVSMLIDDGLLRHQDGSWEVSSDLASVSVPPTIQALLAARLDRLDGDERAVIQAAAVVGKEFGVDDVAAILPEQVRARTAGVVTALVRKELVRPDHEGPRDAFRFRHILIRDAAYNAISKQQRAQLHEQFANWLEEMFPERLSEYEEIIGYHLEQARGYRASLGPVGNSERALGLRAATHLASAARRAQIRGDAPGSINLIERALALAPDDWDERAEMSVRLSDQLYDLGDLQRSIEVARETEVWAAAGGDEATEWLMKVDVAMMEIGHLSLRPVDEARQIALQAIELFDRLGDKRGLAETYNLLAWKHNSLGEHSQMLTYSMKAADYARQLNAELLERRMLAMVHVALYWGPTPTSVAMAYHDRETSRDVRSPFLKRFQLGGRAMILHLAGEVDEARSILQENIMMFEDMGLSRSSVVLKGFVLGNLEMNAGNWDAAVATMRWACDELEAAGQDSSLSTLAGSLALSLYEVGDLDEAFRYTQVSHEAGSEDDLATQLLWRAARGEVLAARGESEQALRYADESVAIADGTEALMWWCESRMARGEVYKVLGRNEEAAADFRRSAELYEQKEAPLYAARARGKLAEVTE
jgi:class 3 adenylate cyclase/tetratricopeptide (TPR) repeat protein